MQVKPVRTAAARAPLPTAAEAAANPALVAAAPPRAPRGVGAILGAGLLGSLLSQAAGCARESEPPPAAMLDADRAATDARGEKRAERSRRAVATLVAPMLQKALDEDGRGAFGCVVVDPPAVLPETEALNLIEQEFAKAGIALRDCYELTGFTQKRTDWQSEPSKVKKLLHGGRDAIHLYFAGDGDPARPQKTLPGKWVFDLATEDGSLLVEFLSTSDNHKLADVDPDGWCSVSSYDLAHRAVRFREELATRKDGKPVTIALFFDPLLSEGSLNEDEKKSVFRQRSDGTASSSDEQWEKDWERREALLETKSLGKLREQVRFFLEWAKREGVL